MADESDALRNCIRKILAECNPLSEERVNDDEESWSFANSRNCTWDLFEEFGFQLLHDIGYKGDYRTTIDAVKEKFKEEGWNFDEM